MNYSRHTSDLSGNNILRITLNPNRKNLESNKLNNIIEIPFFVRDDAIPPILDVTFDGKRIANEDVVSANPQIDILLRDENAFIPLTGDTSLIEVLIYYPAAIPGARFILAMDKSRNFRLSTIRKSGLG